MSTWVSQGVLLGATGPTGPAGSGFQWKGAYAGGTAYVLNDVVSYTDGSNYICTTPTTGHVPTNATYWALYTSAGATGGAGPTGPTGTRGSLFLGHYANFAALPTIDGVTVLVGDQALTDDTSTFYRAT